MKEKTFCSISDIKSRRIESNKPSALTLRITSWRIYESDIILKHKKDIKTKFYGESFILQKQKRVFFVF